MKKILILDASSLFHRAFYGIRPLSTKEGFPTNAVFGYINILKKHLDAIRPDFAAAAFDVHAPTFRHRFDPAYKATRKPMPEELRAQLPFLRKATEAMGIAVVEKEGYEADDILGALSKLAQDGGNEAYLVTGDRDSYQLVSDRVTLILAGTQKDEEITPQVLFEKFGLSPEKMIAVKALAGDTSDNIPGVRGIGEKTAVKLISQFGSLDGVYENPDRLPVGPAAREKLLSGKEDAYRSLFLATICREVPGLERIEDYPYSGFVPELLRPLLVELEFSKMLKGFGLEEAPSPQSPSEEAPLQGSLFDLPETEETREEILDKDVSTIEESPLFLWYDEENFYTLSGDRTVRLVGQVEGFLKENPPVVLNAKEYFHVFHRAFGGTSTLPLLFDLHLAAYVIHSQGTADTLSRLNLLYRKKNTPMDAHRDPAFCLSSLKALYPILKEIIDASPAKDLYYQIELPLAQVLAKMEIRGFQVSVEGIRQYGDMLNATLERLQEEIYQWAGEEFLIHSPKQLGRILFEKLSLPAGKKTKTGYATDAETLGKIRHLSPIVDAVLAYRTYSKLLSTYVEGLLKQVGPDGRIHTVFHQTVTATGRLSSAEPNLQNIPVKTELGREMRRFFTAKENHLLVDADYSQIELRLLAHMSEDPVLCSYFLEGKDIHTKTASEIFHVLPEEVTPEMRKSAKAVNFGIIYGIGEYSLSQDLGIPIYMAKDYIQKYFALFPKVRDFLDGIKASAHQLGYVETLFGRQRQIPELKGPKKSLIAFGERVAMNTPLQGTAADVIKLAMVRVDRRLEKEGRKSTLVLQVHDELILEAPLEEAEEVAKLLSEEMEGAVSYLVPLVAEAQIGKTWYDCK